MNFDFSDDQRALQDELRSFLGEQSPVSRSRKALETATADAALWRQLGELGWLGIAVPEAFGGSGLGPLELALASEEMGRVLAPVPFGSAICGAADLILSEGTEEQKARWLPAVADASAIGTLAMAERPGPLALSNPGATYEGARLSGAKIAVPDGQAATFAIVAARTDQGPRWVLAPLEQAGVTRRPARSVDPSRTVCDLHFERAEAEILGDAGSLERALLRTAVYQSFEQIGGADAVFAMTREYMDVRQAFGKPISSYQALKHRAADIYTAIELARANAYYAAWALSAGSDELAEAACCARVSASQAFQLAATEAIQLHGGIGFTWESDCHLFYRRAKWLGGALGGLGEWRLRLVRALDAQVA